MCQDAVNVSNLILLYSVYTVYVLYYVKECQLSNTGQFKTIYILIFILFFKWYQRYFLPSRLKWPAVEQEPKISAPKFAIFANVVFSPIFVVACERASFATIGGFEYGSSSTVVRLQIFSKSSTSIVRSILCSRFQISDGRDFFS